MVSRLEKLLLGITAALTFSCGEEAAEQCREEREWNGSECVQVSNDYGRDAGNDTAVEEPEPECYTHTDCDDDELCVEGSCESIEEACRIDTSADCNNSSPFFRGVYSVERSDCSMVFQGTPINYFVFFSSSDDCNEYGNVAGFSRLNQSEEPVCGYWEGNRRDGNYFLLEDWNHMFPGSPIEFIQCTPDTIYFQWDNQACGALLTKEEGEFFGNITCPNRQ